MTAVTTIYADVTSALDHFAATVAEAGLRITTEAERLRVILAAALAPQDDDGPDRDNYQTAAETKPIPDGVGGQHVGAPGWRHT